MTEPRTPPTNEQINSLLGHQVQAMFDYDDENAVAVGQLLAWDEGGECVILDDMGFKHWCWPLLRLKERTPD